MDSTVVLLTVAALIAVGVFGIRLIIPSTKPFSVQRASHPRLVRWGSYALISLIGLALSAPAALAHEPVETTPGEIVVVSCQLNDLNTERVARIIATHIPALLDQITVGCHNLANDPLSKPCKLGSSAIGAMPACFISALTVDLFIIDALNSQQTQEWTEVALAESQTGGALAKNQIDIFHLYSAKSAELLVIALPEAGRYDYSLKTESYSSKSWCPKWQPMRGEGTIPVYDGSIYIVTGTSCSGNRVWLADWASKN